MYSSGMCQWSAEQQLGTSAALALCVDICNTFLLEHCTARGCLNGSYQRYFHIVSYVAPAALGVFKGSRGAGLLALHAGIRIAGLKLL